MREKSVLKTQALQQAYIPPLTSGLLGEIATEVGVESLSSTSVMFSGFEEGEARFEVLVVGLEAGRTEKRDKQVKFSLPFFPSLYIHLY